MRKMTKVEQIKKNGGFTDPFYSYYTSRYSSTSFKNNASNAQAYANGTGATVTTPNGRRYYPYR